MGKKSRKGKDLKTWRKVANNMFANVEAAGYDDEGAMYNVPAAVQRLLPRLEHPSTPEERAQLFRDMIAATQTDMNLNDRDKYGDGDQRRLPNDSECQVFRNIWSEGGDVQLLLIPFMIVQGKGITPLGLACVTGQADEVERILGAAKDERHKMQLLELRQSVLRLPALLLCIALAKHPSVVQFQTGRPVSDMDHVGVVKALLKHGARPDAKDVCGKNATHHGAGSMSNEKTLKMADMCIEAAKSCKHYGKTVTLAGLTNESYNGLEGTLGGYLVDQQRRMVTVMLPSKDNPDKKMVKELSLQPKNILFDGHTILDERYKLMDLPDRLGSVPLHEVLMSQQVEAARLLCDRHNASLDVLDINGTTPRQLVFIAAQGGLISDTMELVRDYAIRKQDRSRVCNRCQKVYTKGTGAEKFKRCSRCGEIYYCSRECQVADWSEHKKTCVDVSKGIVLQNPDDAPLSVSSLFPETAKGFSRSVINRNGRFHDGSYQKPKHVATGETFWVKVQITTSGREPHWIYDNSRECSFHVLPGQPGYEELQQKVRLEPASMGRKCHFKAYFDKAGQCTIFPFTAKLLDW